IARHRRHPGQRRWAAHRERGGRRRPRSGPIPRRFHVSIATGPPPSPHAEIVIDLAAIRHNLRRLRELASEGLETAPMVMAVVKADAYGHGMVPVARASREAGADWLGVATGEEALALRE